MIEFPDEIKSAYSNHLLIEAVNRYRFLQPHPSPTNAAKALLVYRLLDDGLPKKTSGQVVYPGSPVLLEPNFVYVVRADITDALLFDGPLQDISAASRVNIVALLSDDYRPVVGSENHIVFETNDPIRLPTAPADTQVCVRFPNPGARRIGFWFSTSAGTVEAEVIARGLPSSLNVQTVIGPGHVELVHVQGTADFVPTDWQVTLTGTGIQPTSAQIFLSFHEEA